MMALPGWLERYRGQCGVGPLVDHTLLRPEATADEILRHCDEAIACGFRTVCVNPQWVTACIHRLSGSGVGVATVAGFPLGATSSAAKAAEVRLAVADGAAEFDVVAPLGWIRSGLWVQVADEFAMVAHAAGGRLVKLILETAALTPDESHRAGTIALGSGIGMLKTSTGFHPAGGATPEAVRLLREVAGSRAGVKASGGVRTPEQAIAMLRAGADRLGSSSAAGWAGLIGPAAPPLEVLLA
jgi:deoxyribose-phosphate aldolase